MTAVAWSLLEEQVTGVLQSCFNAKSDEFAQTSFSSVLL